MHENKWVVQRKNCVPEELCILMQKTILDFDDVKKPITECKCAMYKWLRQDDDMKGEVAAGLCDAQIGIVPFSTGVNGNYTGLMFSTRDSDNYDRNAFWSKCQA
jgi:hypothetical protein